MVVNIMSVDLEDYYCDLPFLSWNKYESRVTESSKIILDLFEKYSVRATFFTLGYIAERHPELIEKIKSKGHEIASHGYSHTNIRRMTIESFEKDLLRSLEVLRKVSGDKVLGFRAPFFSINRENLWAFKVIKKYLQYDSSLFPVRFRYGLADTLTHIYKMSDQDPLKEDIESKFSEIPMTVLSLSGIGNIPIAGGFYLRFLPYQLIKFGINKFNKAGHPAVIYIHPKDLDPKMPHISSYAWHNYWGINSAARKFESALNNFRFSSICEVISCN